MKDYYLRTDTKAQMVAAFEECGVTPKDIDGEVCLMAGIKADIGWIGPVIIPLVMDATSTEAPFIDARFHVNLRTATDLPEEVELKLPIIETPTHPMRIWA